MGKRNAPHLTSLLPVRNTSTLPLGSWRWILAAFHVAASQYSANGVALLKRHLRCTCHVTFLLPHLLKCTVTGYCLAGTLNTGGGDGNRRGLWVKTLTSSVADMRMRRRGGRASAEDARVRRRRRERERRPMRTWEL